MSGAWMPVEVGEDETVADVARAHGFEKWSFIWEADQNAELRKSRTSPNVLQAGDVLYLPPKEKKSEDAATEVRHKFVLKAEPLVLRLRLLDVFGEPVEQKKVTLHQPGGSVDAVPDDQGVVEFPLHPGVKHGVLVVGGIARRLAIGRLDPVETPEGQRDRLLNLGYLLKPVDKATDEDFDSAVEEFEVDKVRKPPTGIVDPAFRDALLKEHGC